MYVLSCKQRRFIIFVLILKFRIAAGTKGQRKEAVSTAEKEVQAARRPCRSIKEKLGEIPQWQKKL